MLTAHLTEKLKTVLPKDAKFAIAFSGGGDSTALVHALKDHPQRGPVYSVDHALRRGSDKEAQAAKRFATTCGYNAKILKWQHNSPRTAIQEKARKARYGLMGEACRQDGIKYLLTAHSRDDQAETLLMRYDRQTDWRGAAGMAEVTYAPLWPELAMVNIVRPLLDVSRAELRDYNRANGLEWSEDPSNANRDYARIRARDYLREHSWTAQHLLKTAKDLRLGRDEENRVLRQHLSEAEFGAAGELIFPHIPSTELMRLAMQCVGGGSGMVDRHRLKALRLKLRSREIESFTYSGAQAVMTASGLVISRDPVAVTGRKDGGLKPQATRMKIKSTPQIWDGRFSVLSETDGCDIYPRYQLALPRTEVLDKYIQSLPRSVRQTAPVIVRESRAYAPSEIPDVTLISLIRPRLEAMLAA